MVGRRQLGLSQHLQQALLASLEMHLDGLDDPVERRAALHEVCGRLGDHLSAAPLSFPSEEQRRHCALVADALHAASEQLRGQMADA
ncbi:hypothetical protein EAH89_30425 [Roseomonas nepalensis]|uniref:Uncharacterized protein n=1 Tax=Muricoccus nepalensis TaxID=1854500 RepID=A0A502EEW4_9PROT|nr:hypothetical protein EAH89_30425 [Roseomonas nepalensis]